MPPTGSSLTPRILGVQDVRDSNEMYFLHLIRDRQPVSRTDLVRETGLRAGTVSVVVNRLLKAGFIYEAEEAPSNGGRRAVYLQVNSEKAYVIAISIGVTQSAFVVSDFNGRILSQHMVRTAGSAASFLKRLCGEILEHIRARYRDIRFLAVGVSVPGLLERAEGRVVLSPNLGWNDVPVRALIEAELKLPVYVENDANAAALSELWYGPLEVSKAHSLLFVLVVEGIGTGFILNGELHIGTRVGSGGFGHIPLDASGPQCSCGNKGCWEAMASDTATVSRFLKMHPERETDVRSMHDLITLVAAGDRDATDEVKKTASFIGQALRGLSHGLAPEVIVIGGQITEAWKVIEPVIRNELKSGYLLENVSLPKLLRASVQDPSIFGGIPLALRTIFSGQSPRRLS
ncbi:MAG TPA: ROK family transcriptional regulator [Bryobacteraceae bacterium]|nr:ROK family transcriptional regulator [Bryobacteraceae bacterium]